MAFLKCYHNEFSNRAVGWGVPSRDVEKCSIFLQVVSYMNRKRSVLESTVMGVMRSARGAVNPIRDWREPRL